MRLWSRYEQENDREALRLLLEYNGEDVMNLVALERIVVGVGLELGDPDGPHEAQAQGTTATDGDPAPHGAPQALGMPGAEGP
jgi:hypothetical protein